MLKAALIENMGQRKDMFGARQFVPLTPSVKPLITNPAIVGDYLYHLRKAGETPGTQFLRAKIPRDFVDTAVQPLSEPNLFNPSRQ